MMVFHTNSSERIRADVRTVAPERAAIYSAYSVPTVIHIETPFVTRGVNCFKNLIDVSAPYSFVVTTAPRTMRDLPSYGLRK